MFGGEHDCYLHLYKRVETALEVVKVKSDFVVFKGVAPTHRNERFGTNHSQARSFAAEKIGS